MKGIISKKNIDRRTTFLICNREVLPANEKFFMLSSLLMISICVQVFFLIAIVDMTYECVQIPDIDCFKKRDGVRISDTFAYNESPVNCSTLSKDVLVTCYRITVLDPERAFTAAAATYLLLKILNFVFLVVSHVMLWIVKKWKGRTLTLIQVIFSVFMAIVIWVPPILQIFLDEVDSAFRKLSYTVVTQLAVVVLFIAGYVFGIPWEEFRDRVEYFVDASEPINDDTSKPNNVKHQNPLMSTHQKPTMSAHQNPSMSTHQNPSMMLK